MLMEILRQTTKTLWCFSHYLRVKSLKYLQNELPAVAGVMSLALTVYFVYVCQRSCVEQVHRIVITTQ